MLKFASFHQVMSDTDKQRYFFYLCKILIIKKLKKVHQIFQMLE